MSGVVAYAWWSRESSPTALADKVLQTFESGGKPGWDAHFQKDASASIERPDLEKTLEGYFYPTPEGDLSAHYVVLFGEAGTGKSTAIRRVVRDRKGVNGAIYVNVTCHVPSLGGLIATAVGLPEAIVDVDAGFLRILNHETKTIRDVPTSEEPSATWRKAAPAIDKAAVSFRKKHGRPAVLIIDSAELLAKYRPAFLAELQAYAKDKADGGTLRMVFVSSERDVLEQLDSWSASSRGLEPVEVVEVVDICDPDAVKFLVEEGMEREEAEVAVRDFTGGRFTLLQRYLANWKDNTVLVTRTYPLRETKDVLQTAGIGERHAFFETLLAKKVIDEHAARQLWGKDSFDPVMRVLLDRDIVAAHPNSTYTFHSRHVETFFRAVFGADGEEGTSWHE